MTLELNAYNPPENLTVIKQITLNLLNQEKNCKNGNKKQTKKSIVEQ